MLVWSGLREPSRAAWWKQEPREQPASFQVCRTTGLARCLFLCSAFLLGGRLSAPAPRLPSLCSAPLACAGAHMPISGAVHDSQGFGDTETQPHRRTQPAGAAQEHPCISSIPGSGPLVSPLPHDPSNLGTCHGAAGPVSPVVQRSLLGAVSPIPPPPFSPVFLTLLSFCNGSPSAAAGEARVLFMGDGIAQPGIWPSSPAHQACMWCTHRFLNETAASLAAMPQEQRVKMGLELGPPP